MTSQLLSSVSGVRVNHLRSSFLRFSQSFRLILSAQPIIILFSFVDLILLFVSFIFLLFSSLICYVCHERSEEGITDFIINGIRKERQ